MLVVDDNVDSASTLARLLTLLWKQDVRTAVDGPSALRTAREFLPELIFLDIGLPGLSGYQVAKELRATPEFATTTAEPAVTPRAWPPVPAVSLTCTKCGSVEDHATVSERSHCVPAVP